MARRGEGQLGLLRWLLAVEEKEVVACGGGRAVREGEEEGRRTKKWRKECDGSLLQQMGFIQK